MAKRISLLVAVFTLVATSLAFSASGTENLSWELTPTGASTTRLRGLSVVSEHVVWTSGGPQSMTTGPAAVLRTINGGRTWQTVTPPGAEQLELRDIEAFDRRNAVVLAAGSGTDARVYVTSDGGQTWHLGFQNADPDPAVFYDCMTFFDRRHGLALSDPVGGRFRIIETRDGGRSWRIVDADMPPAIPGEFAFAASGQCLVSTGDIHTEHGDDDDDDRGERNEAKAWFATGGVPPVARVFRTRDGGKSWRVSATPVAAVAAGGIFALAFRDEEHGLAVGGDFLRPAAAEDAAALTRDGGRSWTLIEDPPSGYRSGAAWVDHRTAVAVGPLGSDVSFDRGRSWSLFDTGSFDTVDCTDDDNCWASGEQGRVARLVTDEDD